MGALAEESLDHGPPPVPVIFPSLAQAPEAAGGPVDNVHSKRAGRKAATAEFVAAGAKPGSKRNELHVALMANDTAAAADLIETANEELLNQPSSRGITPLMLVAMGHCKEELAWRLLERRASAGAALRSCNRRTAADYAEECRQRVKGNGEAARSTDLVQSLRAIEATEVDRTKSCRCPVCGDIATKAGRRTCLAFFWERAEKGEEENEMMRRFFSRSCFRPLLEPRHHKINDYRLVRKELSESLAVIEALEVSLPDFGPAWHVVDLCCGRCVTASLLAMRHPGVTITTIDRLEPRIFPHLDGMEDHGVRYERLDVLSDAFIPELSRLVQHAGRPSALLGMHLCGGLSLRAAEAFGAVGGIRGCVLSPCCLPAKDWEKSPPHLYATKDDSEQYGLWCVHLEAALCEAAPAATVTRAEVREILSPKNVVLCATKAGSEAGVVSTVDA